MASFWHCLFNISLFSHLKAMDARQPVAPLLPCLVQIIPTNSHLWPPMELGNCWCLITRNNRLKYLSVIRIHLQNHIKHKAHFYAKKVRNEYIFWNSRQAGYFTQERDTEKSHHLENSATFYFVLGGKTPTNFVDCFFENAPNFWCHICPPWKFRNELNLKMSTTKKPYWKLLF